MVFMTRSSWILGALTPTRLVSSALSRDKDGPIGYNSGMRSRAAKYTSGEIGRLNVIGDFLPVPDDLVPREDDVKVTLSLSRRSLDFFKREAKRHRVSHQRMIRSLLDAYAEQHAGRKN